MMLEKRKVLEACIKVQESKIEDIEQSLEKTKQAVIEAPSSRTSWSDTTRFQQSNLALGIQRRLEEAKLVLSQLRIVDIGVQDTIFVGALFVLKNINTGEVNRYFLIPEGGGDLFGVEGEEVTAISAKAPLAETVIGKKKGDKVSFRDRSFEVINVQ